MSDEQQPRRKLALVLRPATQRDCTGCVFEFDLTSARSCLYYTLCGDDHIFVAELEECIPYTRRVAPEEDTGE